MTERTPQSGTREASARVKQMPLMILITTITGAAVAPALAAADLDKTVDFHIPAQPLDSALLEFSKQAHVQLAVNSHFIGKLSAPSVDGSFVASAALFELLRHSGLEYVTVGNTVTVSPIQTMSKSEGGGQALSTTAPNPSTRITRAGGSVDESGGSRGSNSSQQLSTGMEEVLVSAEKRTERLQDVPVPVTALSADSLLLSNQLRLQDYFTSVPGLSLSSDGARNGFPTLSIRGVTTGPGTNPTVGITVDDVPYGSSTELGGGDWVPDVDPSDLARVEVLRGPQGTLYGASSLGGLVKYVTVDPSTDGFSGRVQAGTDFVHNGSQAGFNFRGAVNVPLSDTVAVRGSLFARRDPGYVDNPILNRSGVNLEDVDGGRLSALWRPNENLSLKLGALFQRDKAYGSPNVALPSAGLGDLQQNALPRSGGFDRKAEVFSANLSAKLGAVDLVSVTGYSINQIYNSIDYTFALGFLTGPLLGGPTKDPGTEVLERNKTKKFTQEIRLSGSATPWMDWLVGGFFAHESSPYAQDIISVDSATAVQTGIWGTLTFPTTYQEFAGFTDLTFHLTDRFDIQLGGRESHIKQTSSEDNIGELYDSIFLGSPTSPVLFPEVTTSANAFTYLVTPRFKISSDFMVYARLASGYRAGGANVAPGVPRSYSPDKTQNYEVGIKGDLIPRTLSVDASLYRIDWKDIQLGLLDPTSQQGYNANATRARSQGIELAVQAHPIGGLSIASWVAWNDAKLTEGFPAASTAVGVSGDRLPYGSKFSGNVSLDDEFPLVGELTGFAGGTVSYVGSRVGPFPSAFALTTARQEFPGYAKTDLRAGVKYDSWTANFFVNNAADRRVAMSGGIAALNPTVFTYIQPRTIGLWVAKTF